LLDVSVAARLRGAGPVVAAHLSAGLDSGAVTSTAARILGDEGAALLAFTAVPRIHSADQITGAIADESLLAGAVVRPFANVEHIMTPGHRSLTAAFARNVQLWERPAPNMINDLWWSKITCAARGRGARILLTAPMGNLSLSHSGEEIFTELLASFRWIALARALSDTRRVQGARAKRLALSMFASHLPRSLWSAMQRARGRRATSDFLLPAGAAARFDDLDDLAGPSKSALERRLSLIAAIDPGSFNAGAAAGWGVDMRDPLADKRLMEFALSLPTEMFFNRGVSRALARRTLADRLPDQVLLELRKGYQAADWVQTLHDNRDELLAEAEAIAVSPAAELIDTRALIEALRTMPQQDWSSARTRHLYGRSLVGALSAGHFLRSARK
jgi:asparagine synthase (glutamine-hydrolysing)